MRRHQGFNSLRTQRTLHAIGCNFELSGWKLEADSDSFRHLLAERHILFQLAVTVPPVLAWPTGC